MQINGVNFLESASLQKNTQVSNNNQNFTQYLKQALDKVNDVQINAENQTKALITGEAQNLHEVMLATEEARLALELSVQIRNKLVDAYQEMMRMQI